MWILLCLLTPTNCNTSSSNLQLSPLQLFLSPHLLQLCLCIRYYLKLQTLCITLTYHSFNKNSNKNGDNDSSSRNNNIIITPNLFVSIKAVTMMDSVFLDTTPWNIVQFILNPPAKWKLHILRNISNYLPKYSVTYHKTVSFMFELRHSTYPEVNS